MQHIHTLINILWYFYNTVKQDSVKRAVHQKQPVRSKLSLLPLPTRNRMEKPHLAIREGGKEKQMTSGKESGGKDGDGMKRMR